MTILHSDRQWLAAAARLAMRGRPASRPNPSVGAIIIKHGKVIGRGWTQEGGRPHGEAQALAQAGQAAQGAAMYVSLEPCAHPSQRGPTCSSLVTQAKLARLIYGHVDPDVRTAGSGAQQMRASGVDVQHIDCETSTASLAGYLSQKRIGRPFITLKLAMSLDGFIARPDGESQWITGPQARAHVHSRRAQSDAILVGGATWRTDKPRLDVRLPGLEARSPQRLVLSRLEIGGDIHTLHSPAAVFDMPSVQYLYVEGGAQTAASFLKERLVDRIEIYRAPILLGSGIAALGEYGLGRLADAHGQWQLAERRMLGSDTYEAYDRASI